MFSASIIIILLLVGVFAYNKFDSQEDDEPKKTETNKTYKSIEFGIAEEKDFLNFEELLSKNKMIQDLPKNGIIFMRFYNYYSDEREWEKDYTLTKGNVIVGKPEKYDLSIWLHSKYLTILKENDFCSIVKLAKTKGDFGSSTEIGTSSLIWKYKGMMGYKDCLGF